MASKNHLYTMGVFQKKQDQLNLKEPLEINCSVPQTNTFAPWREKLTFYPGDLKGLFWFSVYSIAAGKKKLDQPMLTLQ